MIPLNVLVCPTQSSDPTTAFDVSYDLNALVLGATSGRVYAYKLHQVQRLQSLSRPPRLMGSKLGGEGRRTAILSVHVNSTQQPLRFDCADSYCLVSDSERIETKFVPCAVCGLSVTEVPVEYQKDVLCSYCGPARVEGDTQQNNVYPQFPFKGVTSEFTQVPGYGSAKDANVNSDLLVKPIPTEWKCKVICERADEGVRAIYIVPMSATNIPQSSYIKPGTVCMTIGDIMVRLAVSLTSQQCLNMKFQRRHYVDQCEETVVLQHGMRSVLLIPGDRINCVMLDCSLHKQFTLSQLDIPSGAVPFAFTEKYLAWHTVKRDKDMQRVFSMASVDSQRTLFQSHLSGQKRVVQSRVCGDRLVCVVGGSFVEVRNFSPIDYVNAIKAKYSSGSSNNSNMSNISSNSSNSSNNNNTNGSVMTTEEDFWNSIGALYAPGLSANDVKNQRSSAKHVWSPVGYVNPGARTSYPDAVSELLSVSKGLRCVKFAAHERGTVVGLLVENNGEDIITLGNDMKIKFWHKGRLVLKGVNLRGSFHQRTPVLLKRAGRAVYYTADDGIFAFVCPTEIEDEDGNLCLSQQLPQ